MKNILNVIYLLFLGILICIASLSTLTLLSLPYQFRIFYIKSGSMEPKLKKGSLIIVQAKKEYMKNDIITFKSFPGSDLKDPRSLITHRIVDITKGEKEAIYQTKGDANKSPDMNLRPKNSVLGKVEYVIPYIGYPIGVAKTQIGFIILIVIPATLLIYTELMNIKNEALRLIKESKTRKLTAFEKVEEEIGEDIIKIEKEVKKDVKKITKKK